ncbi:MAG: hypothetical protein JXR52_05750 [Bacteroidales bacterium]|nr:hypothetical protein [Bacteroidales bacterium]
MKLPRKLFACAVLSAAGMFVSAQDILFSIIAEYNNEKVSIDSLSFVNLSRETSLSFTDLPVMEEYVINLTTQEVVEPIGMTVFKQESAFRVLRCLPGQLVISCDMERTLKSAVDIISADGRIIHSSDLKSVSGYGSIRVDQGIAGICFVRFRSPVETRVFKAIGSVPGNRLEIQFEDRGPYGGADLKGALIPDEDGFTVEVGDSLLVTAYKDTLTADPVELVVAENNTIEFTFTADTTEASFLRINDTQCDLVEGLLANIGNFEGKGIYNHTLILLSPGHNMDWETLETDGSGAVVEFEIFNTGPEVMPGTYPFSLPEIMNTELECGIDYNGDGVINEDDCFYKLPDGEKYISTRLSGYDSNVNLYEFDGWLFESGSASIAKEGDIYIIEFDGVGENGDVIEGVYKGTLHLFDFSEPEDTMKIEDVDGNVYDIVQIGNQWWMAEDLRTTHYANGDPIPDGTGIGDYSGETEPAYWFAYNDNTEEVLTYGRLYTWYAASDPRNVCPAGWYLPGDADWDTLAAYLGGDEVAGGKMKEAGTEHWLSPNEGATNESGFTGLPSGFRRPFAGFDNLSTYGLWWSSTHTDEKEAWIRDAGYSTSSLMATHLDKRYGISVRCIRDTGIPGTLPSVLTLDASDITETSVVLNWHITNDGGAIITETGVYFGTEPDPHLTGSKVAAGNQSGLNSVTLSGLPHSTCYYYRAYAVNSSGEAIANERVFITDIITETSSVTDIDGNSYRTVRLWDKWWMAENLKVTHYADGLPIPPEADQTAWSNLSTPGYCWYDNDSAANAGTYGALYNWYTVGTGNLCPSGWRVPSEDDWNSLIMHLGGANVAGGYLKEAGTEHWISPNTGATDDAEFTALPGGFRRASGAFSSIGGYGRWWSSSESEYDPNLGRNLTLQYNGANATDRSDNKVEGYSVRCVKDTAVTEPEVEIWETYTNKNKVNALAVQDNYLWIGTSGGLVKYDMVSQTVDSYDNLDGLSDNDIKDIDIDIHGNIWMGTGYGISMFNGSDWSRYYQDITILSVAADPSGNIWFGTYGKGVYRYDGSAWIHYDNLNSGLVYPSVYAICVDQSGKVWFGTYDKGISVFDGENWTSYSTANSGLGNDMIRALEAGDQGKMYIGTYSGGLSLFDGGSWTNYTTANSGLLTNRIISLEFVNDSSLWVGTSSGSFLFNGESWTSFSPANSGLSHWNINSIAVDNSGKAWFGTGDQFGGKGVDAFDGISWSNFQMQNELPHNEVHSVYIDEEQDVWFGTVGGVGVFDGVDWTVINKETSGLIYNNVYAINKENNGVMWFAIASWGGVASFDGENWTSYVTSNSGLASNDVRSMAIDRDGNKWFGTFSKGISVFNGTDWVTYDESNSGLGSNSIMSITVEENGDVWIGTYYGGVSHYNGSVITTYNTSNSGLPSNYVTDIAVDSSGNKWITTLYGGVCKFDGTKWTVYEPPDFGMNHKYVNSVFIDAEDNKWFGMYSTGLCRFDGENWTNYNTQNNGLASISVSDIAADAEGNYWIATYNGVSKLRLE